MNITKITTHFFKPLAVLMIPMMGVSCAQVSEETKTTTKTTSNLVVPVDPTHFVSKSLVGKIVQEERTLADGTKALCYVIQTYSEPHEHAMGPWAPKTITDGKEKGGIWFHDGKVHDLDGPFVKNMDKFYDDPEWKLYRDDGSVRVTDTKEAFEAAARPDVDPRYNNYVVEGRPEWFGRHITTYVIPVKPVYQTQPTRISGGGPPGGVPQGKRPAGERPLGGGAPANGGGGGIGVAFNGVKFDPPAPINAIIGAHTIAPFDHAGGHINPHEGYHYHAATGKTKEIAQPDGHAPMIGYALDGFGIFAHLDAAGKAATELDECGGHSDDKRGYHYHAGAPGSNQIISAFRGKSGTMTVAK